MVVSTSQGLDQGLNAFLCHIFLLQAQSVIHWCKDGHFTCVKTDTFQQCCSTRDVCAFLLLFLLNTSQAQRATTSQNRALLQISFTVISQFGVSNLQGEPFRWGLGELGGVVRTVCRCGVFSSWWWRNKLPARLLSKGICAPSWKLESGAVCETVLRSKFSPPSETLWHKLLVSAMNIVVEKRGNLC